MGRSKKETCGKPDLQKVNHLPYLHPGFDQSPLPHLPFSNLCPNLWHGQSHIFRVDPPHPDLCLGRVRIRVGSNVSPGWGEIRVCRKCDDESAKEIV